MQTVKIGFGYKAQRGKDTACHAIINRLGRFLNVKQYAFADELRAEVDCALFDRWVQDLRGVDFDAQKAMRHLCEWAGVPYDTSAPISAAYPYGKQRALYQWYGTEHRRAIDPDYWVKKLAARIEHDRPAFAIISDLRFANEFDFCDYRVRMDRPGFEVDAGADHISEHVLDAKSAHEWHVIIKADSARDVERLAVHHFWHIARHYVEHAAQDCP